MNFYSKYMPNVFLAKCEKAHEKGEIITMSTKYGSEHNVIIFNLIFEREGFFYYSVVREDGFNFQEHARRKAEKLTSAANNASRKSNEAYQASHEGRDFLSLGEPIKVGHHSEHRHRALIERNHQRMQKCITMGEVAEDYNNRAAYWERRAANINLSMPESLEYFAFVLEAAKAKHAGIKNGTIEKRHSYSLTYAKKEVNEAEKKYNLAVKLWGDEVL